MIQSASGGFPVVLGNQNIGIEGVGTGGFQGWDLEDVKDVGRVEK